MHMSRDVIANSPGIVHKNFLLDARFWYRKQNCSWLGLFRRKKAGISVDFFFWEAPQSKPTNPTTLRLPVALGLLVTCPVLSRRFQILIALTWCVRHVLVGFDSIFFRIWLRQVRSVLLCSGLRCRVVVDFSVYSDRPTKVCVSILFFQEKPLNDYVRIPRPDGV